MNREDLKREAKEFLRALETDLTSHIPPPREMRTEIHKIVADAKDDPSRKHMRKPEDAFLYYHSLPVIFGKVQALV